MHNQRISSIFQEIAALLEMQGDDPFRIRAYRRAAHTLGHLRESLRSVSQRQALEDIPDIGPALAKNITEFLDTGQIRYHDHLKSTVPEGVLPLLHFTSLSTDHVRTLWRQHDVTSLKHLVQLSQDGQLPFDDASNAAIHKEIEAWQRRQQRMLLGMALPRAELLVHNIARLPQVERISIAGSLRRGVDMAGDINIVAASPDPTRLIERCIRQPEVRQVVDTTPISTVLLTSEGLRVALVVVPPEQFPTALLYYTGSAAHVAALQQLALHRRLRLTPFGLVRLDDGSTCPVEEEEDIYHHLGIPYIAPELREGAGEIEAAQAGVLPILLTLDDIRGDLHVHSNWGNGAHSLEDIARMAQRLGYEYVAICDYTYAPETGQGLTAADLLKQIEAIRRLNDTLPTSFRLLAGAEVELSPEGDVLVDEAVLQELDFVVAAVHTGLKAPLDVLTRRLCKGMEHPLVNVLAHPTGRMLGKEQVPSVDLDVLLDAAIETHTCLEINSHVLRLDLQDTAVRLAKDLGIPLALGSDAHSVQEMRSMQFGVLTARRGWTPPQHVLNTLPYAELLRRLKPQDTLHAQ